MNISLEWMVVFVGLAAIVLELVLGVATGFDLLLIGSSLVAGGLIGVWQGSWQVGLGVSIVLAVLYLVLGRQYLRKTLAIDTQKTNIDKLIGRSAVVTRAITPGHAGQVRVGGEVWRAEAGKAIKSGAHVKIQSIEGVTLKVI